MITLLFVYNARSGTLNALLEGIHKIVSPSTYSCKLCTLTHGAFQERELWKAFRQSTALNMEFYHRDEFLQNYMAERNDQWEFPVILTKTETGLNVFLSKEELEILNTEAALIQAIKVKLKTL